MYHYIWASYRKYGPNLTYMDLKTDLFPHGTLLFKENPPLLT